MGTHSILFSAVDICGMCKDINIHDSTIVVESVTCDMAVEGEGVC
jgi:hypothetical protein